MKKLLLFTLIFFCVNSLIGQQLYLESGKTISSFDYKNSQGESLDNLQSSNHTYLSLGYRKTIFAKDLFINLNATYSGYGSIGSDRALDNYFEWDLSYLGANVGFDYEFYKPGDFTFFVKVATSAEFLIHGTQTLNNQVYKLPGEQDFDTAIYFFRGGLGIQYKASENFTVFNQYMYGFSGTFKNIQGDLKIRAHNFGLGLLINISKNKGTSIGIVSTQIEELKKELEANSQKIGELQDLNQKIQILEKSALKRDKEIGAKEGEIKALKDAILNAMMPYKGDDLTIEEQQDRVKIVLDSDMLFKSGSWIITKEGEKAVETLGVVLASNPDIAIRVEGHTDNVSYEGKGNIKNNWDLSNKRATAIVEILKNNKDINLTNLSAVGRGEHNPIGDNSTTEGRSKNRRIEIILAPQLTELMKIIKN